MGRSTPIRKKFAIIGAGQQASRNREETKNYPVDLLLCFCLIIFWTAGGSPPAHVGGALWSCPPREKRTKPRGTRAAGWRRPPLRRSANDKVSSARSDPPPIPVRRSTFSDPPFHPLGPPFHSFWSAVQTTLNFRRPRETRKHRLAGRIFQNFRHFEHSIASTKSAVEVQLRCPDGAPRDCEGEGGAFQACHGRRPSWLTARAARAAAPSSEGQV